MMKVLGQKVYWHTGFDGYDHGKPCWWAQTKTGTVVNMKDDKLLLELKDGTRAWAKYSDCEFEHQKKEREERERLEREKREKEKSEPYYYGIDVTYSSG